MRIGLLRDPFPKENTEHEKHCARHGGCYAFNMLWSAATKSDSRERPPREEETAMDAGARRSFSCG